MKIEAINYTSPYLKAVKALGRANAGTLGLFPEGAFDDHAKRGTILVVIDDQGKCVGYLLYRIRYGYAYIVHLCVDTAVRGAGLAHLLVDKLSEFTQLLRGIRADCRRDYTVNGMWPRLGFSAVGERPGRAKRGTLLTIWWLDHGHPDLLTMATFNQDESKLRVAIDANVFYDLHDSRRPDYEEAHALLADWLQVEVELGVSPELWNEINRGSDEVERRRARSDAERLTQFSSGHAAFVSAQKALHQFFPQNMSWNDEADLRHLAWAIAAEVPFFVTRDTDLLSRSDDIYNAFGVSILRPSDLIVHLDELRRETEYQPARLGGTLMELRRIQSKEQSNLGTLFRQESQGETRSDFNRLIQRLLAAPTAHDCLLFLDDSQTPLALIAYDRSRPDTLTVPLFRVRRGLLATTLVRYGILSTLKQSANEHRVATYISDPYLNDIVTTALQEDAFIQVSAGWLKLNLPVAEPASILSSRLQTLADADDRIAEHARHITTVLSTPDITLNTHTMIDLEGLLWPAKIVDANIPTFLIPIKPQFAHELFDVQLANQTLFGSMKQLALNREAVYYKSLKPQIFSAPGRILWYVSRDEQKHYQGGSEVRACSRLDEVVVGLPKDLYRRFRRFGIYEWSHLLEAAKGDINQSVMALRFSNTELFTTPVPLAELRAVYGSIGRGLPIQGSSRLPSAQIFAQVYRRGMNIAGHESSISADVSYS